jgi:hypothetical protein
LLVFSVLLAAGTTTPAFKLFFHVIPGLSWFRLHSRATLFVSLVLVLAAGRLLSRPSPRPRGEIIGFVLAALAMLVSGLLFIGLWPGFSGAVLPQALIRFGFIGATAAIGVAWMVRAPKARERTLLEIGLAVALIADLGLAAAHLKQQNRGSDEEMAETLVHRLLAKAGSFSPSGVPPRIFFPYLRENAGVQQGWSAPSGYVSLNLGRVWNYIHATVGVTPSV